MGYWVAHRLPRFLCRILDPTNLNLNQRTMQTVYSFNIQVVLGLEPDEVGELGHHALYLNWGSAGSTQKVRVVIHRGRYPGPVEVTLEVSSVRCGVWCRRRWVHLVSSQQMPRFLVRMPQMLQMLWVGGWLTRQRWSGGWVRSKGVGRCLGWTKVERPQVLTQPNGAVNLPLRRTAQLNLALCYRLHTFSSSLSPTLVQGRARKGASRT